MVNGVVGNYCVDKANWLVARASKQLWIVFQVVYSPASKEEASAKLPFMAGRGQPTWPCSFV